MLFLIGLLNIFSLSVFFFFFFSLDQLILLTGMSDTLSNASIEYQISACNVGGLSSIPGLGRSRGEGKCYPLQCSGLGNSMGSQRDGHD